MPEGTVIHGEHLFDLHFADLPGHAVEIENGVERLFDLHGERGVFLSRHNGGVFDARDDILGRHPIGVRPEGAILRKNGARFLGVVLAHESEGVGRGVGSGVNIFMLGTRPNVFGSVLPAIYCVAIISPCSFIVA